MLPTRSAPALPTNSAVGEQHGIVQHGRMQWRRDDVSRRGTWHGNRLDQSYDGNSHGLCEPKRAT
jgi:hypothetical protein